jgi:hypothetical protein
MEFLSQIIAKVIAFFFAMLFCIVTILTMLAFNLDQLALQPGVYKSALQKIDFYEKLPSLMSQEIQVFLNYEQTHSLDYSQSSSSADTQNVQGFGELAKYLRLLDQNEMASVVQTFFPPDKQKIVTENLIDQLSTFLDGDTSQIKISWIDLKEKLKGEDGLKLVFSIMVSQPACTQEQLIALSQGSLEKPEDLIVCNVPEDVRAAITPQIKSALESMSQSIPNEMVFDIDKFQSNPNNASEPPSRVLMGENPSQVIKIVRLGMRLSPIFAVALIMLIALFGVRSFRDLLIWWGIPFFVVGVLGLATALLVSPFTNWFFQTSVAPRAVVYFIPSLVDIGGNILQYVAGRYAQWIIVEAGLLLIFGITALIALFKLKRK